MKRKTLSLLLVCFLTTTVLLAAFIPKQSAAEQFICNSQGFIITGADANWCESTTTPSVEFTTLLELVSPRVAAHYALSVLRQPLTAVPPGLEQLLTQVVERVGFDYVDAHKRMAMTYPAEIVNDTAAPQVQGPVTQSSTGTTTAAIHWTTNEFADSVVHFGLQSGNYTQTVSDDLYVTDHRLELINLQTGITYYFQLASTDQSGNTFNSGEYNFTFTPQVHTYLPLVVR